MGIDRIIRGALLLAAVFFIVGAGTNKTLTDQAEKQPTLETTSTGTSDVAPAPTLHEGASDERAATAQPEAAQPQAPNFHLNWWSVNGGGAISAASANYQMGLSVGQGAAGTASSANFAMGIGFWYGAAGAGGGVCLVTTTGDVNTDAVITSADIIYLVGYVFKGGPAPGPCEAAGDVNCDGTVTSADIIYLVGYVFKGGPAPCDVCSLIPGTWSCP